MIDMKAYNNKNIVNIDSLCAQYGFEIIKEGNFKKPTLINKALDVLQEQGLYAYFLFLDSRSTDEQYLAKKISEKSFKLIKEIILKTNNNSSQSEDIYEELKKKILNNLDELFLTIQILEQMLIYAKFHIKTEK
ncbi:MAG: hypothetical protein ACP6IY_18050 [Promethearchaeia archaeon]